jgi:hypothetical protein
MKIKITNSPRSLAGNVFIYFERGNGKISVLQPDMKTLVDIGEHEPIDPTFEVPNMQDFINAMGEAVMEYGYKGNKEAKNDGNLQATKYHLEDLRRLLKLT